MKLVLGACASLALLGTAAYADEWVPDSTNCDSTPVEVKSPLFYIPGLREAGTTKISDTRTFTVSGDATQAPPWYAVLATLGTVTLSPKNDNYAYAAISANKIRMFGSKWTYEIALQGFTEWDGQIYKGHVHRLNGTGSWVFVKFWDELQDLPTAPPGEAQ